MQALVVRPGEAHTTRVEDVPQLPVREDEVLVRTLEVGVCGTDREISEGHFGVPPEGDDVLVLGHEFLGRVERDGHGFARGDLVTSIVRRPCAHCLACNDGAPDSCLTGDYSERGITRLHGFARELVPEDPAQLIGIPRSLGRLGVLVEPTSICERGIRHARASAAARPWELQQALVIGRARSGCSRRTSSASRGSTSGRPGAARRVIPGRSWRRPRARATSRPRLSRSRRYGTRPAASTSSSRRPATPR